LKTKITEGEKLSEQVIIDEEEIKKIDEETGIEVQPKKKKKKANEELLPLEKVSGKEVVEILNFLHRKYLEYMTQVEGAKYMGVYKSIKDEALKETLEVYAELQKQNQMLMEKLERLVNALEGKIIQQEQPQIQPEALAKTTAEEIKRVF
jgi:hypothetical protein